MSQNNNSDSWPFIRDETIEAVTTYLHQKKSISISESVGIIKELESKLGNWLNRQYVLTTNSGTNAIFAAMFSLNLEAGSEIIAPVFTFHATITPSLHARLTPVLVDVESDTGNICVNAIERAITDKTRCIIINHTWGHPVDIYAILKICKKYNLYLIEDCSHAYGSMINNRLVGTFGDISVFSMQANKMLPAGEGGFLTTNNKIFYERSVLLGHYRGRSNTVTNPIYKSISETGFGLKFRIHPLAAVIASSEFDYMYDNITNRKILYETLTNSLIELPFIDSPTIKNYVEMGCYFGYRPKYIEGFLKKDGIDITLEEFINIMNSNGVPIRKPSVKSLNFEPIFQNNSISVGANSDTWKPRLCEPFIGLDEYSKNRLSFPLLTKKESLETIQHYISSLEFVYHKYG